MYFNSLQFLTAEAAYRRESLVSTPGTNGQPRTPQAKRQLRWLSLPVRPLAAWAR